MSKNLKEIIGNKVKLVAIYRTLRAVPFSFNAGPFGRITKIDEILNLHDNFGKGELRFPEIERHIASEKNPIVFDCGVNVGITVRW